MILDKNSKIEISKIVYLYKQFFNINNNLSNIEKKKFNKQIYNEFCNFFQTQKQYYIGCKILNY